MKKQLTGTTKKIESTLTRFRDFVRGVMPTVALVAAVLFILRTLFGNTFLYGDNFFGNLLSAITTLIIFITIAYYGYKVLRWIKRKVFWRVRRRLLITYLFVGLTPIVLLSGLGFLFCYGLALNAMSASVMSQADATQKQALETARALADELVSTTDENNLKKVLDDRTKLLQISLPGARIAVWRGNNGKAYNEDSKLTSEIFNEKTKGLGSDNTPLGTKLPQWLKGKNEFSGFCFTSPQNENEEFRPASFRAVVNRKRNGNEVTLLLIVPVSRTMVEQYRANTNLDVRPFFRNEDHIIIDNDENGVRIETNEKDNNGEQTGERKQKPYSGKDQLGETKQGTYAWIILPATNWADGQTDKYISFIFSSSLTAVSNHFLQRGYLGQSFNLRLVLNVFGVIFLILEGTALIAAVLMTRAVTRMVHRLYRGTQFVKQGDFSHRIKSNSHDQLGELANAFNDMSSHIETLLQERVAHERLEKEVEIAAQVQSRLFPERVPDLLSVEIAAECRAARGVAGDYYDYIEILPGLVALALGDVSGKGMSASLVMANLQASLRSQAAITAERLSIAARAAAASSAGNTDRTLMRVMADANIDGAISRQCFNINKQLCQSTEDNRFATLFLALYEDRTRKLRYTNAGHNAPILIRNDGTYERLSTGGMMVGAFDFAKYDEGTLTINPDDILVVFSDGISEAESETGTEYTEERVVKFVIENRNLSAHNLRDAIFNEIDKWAGTKERGDDQTILILKGRD